MNRLLTGVALSAIVMSTAAAASKLDAKLLAAVDKQGRVTATLEITNNGHRPICFLAQRDACRP